MRRERPVIVDLSLRAGADLAAALRDRREAVADAYARSVVLDLGPRRQLPADAAGELILLHRALRAAGGRCAVVVGPALAAQLSLAYPEGILWAATRSAAIAALRTDQRRLRGRVRTRGQTVYLNLAGELDMETVPVIAAALRRIVAAAQRRRPVVVELSELTFVDLVGLRTLTTAIVRCQLAGAPTRVVGARAQLRKLADQLGWSEQLPGLDDATVGPRASEVLAELDDQFDTGAQAVIATDLAGRVTHWNRAAERLYGWTRAEVLGRAITDLTVGPDDQQLADQIMDSVRRTGTWEGTFTVRRKDGRTFTAHVHDTIMEDEHGQPIGLLGTSIEASEPTDAVADRALR
jgi:anti-anti-sigma factor